MSARLPEDVLHLICDVLQECDDFTTLFSLATVNKVVAPIALSHLYRLQFSPRNNEENEGLNRPVEQELDVQRWSIYWRSIWLATMGKTLYPYHRYLRILDLRDLEYLLDSNFGGKTERSFFRAPLNKYHHQVDTFLTRGGKTLKQINTPLVLRDAGEAIIQSTDVLEQVYGNLPLEAFRGWITKLPRLRRLELYDGKVLADANVRQAIIEHCPHFEALTMFSWSDSQADAQLGAFISGLRPQTLREFTTFSSNCGVSTDTCAALNAHGQSLKKLQLGFHLEAIEALAVSSKCTAVEVLHLSVPDQLDLVDSHNDIFEDLLAWLGECRQLKDLTLNGSKSGPALLTPVLFNDRLELEQLELNAKSSLIDRQFHLALSHQRGLRKLWLNRLYNSSNFDEVEDELFNYDALVDSIGQMSKLTNLKLQGVADDIVDEQVIRLLTPLHALEELHIGGWNLSDAVLHSVASLPKLKAVTFVGLTCFTAAGLLDLVDKLHMSKDGFYMSIFNADPTCQLNEDELALVRDVLGQKIGGKLDYLAGRDPNEPDSEDFSD